MLNLYEKVPKNMDNLRGIRKIEKSEDFLLKRPTLLCVSAQDIPKSVFGISKFGMEVAGVRVRNQNENGYDLQEFPVAFCGIRNEQSTVDFDEFYENYLKTLVEDNSAKRNINEVAKGLRNINILAYCNGTERVVNIIETLKNKMQELGYSESEIEYAISQIGLVTVSTDLDTRGLGCTVVDFHDINDKEIHNGRINENTVENMAQNNETEELSTIDERRVEYIVIGNGEHNLKHFFRDGNATPACFKRVIINLLESSINASRGQFKPLTTEIMVKGCLELLQEARDGKSKEELLSSVDKITTFSGAKRLTVAESKALNQLDSSYDMIIRLENSNRLNEEQTQRLQAKIENMDKVAKECCSDATYLRILQARGWQFNKEQAEEIANTLPDRELIGNQKRTINSQSEQILSLQKMLKKTLNFADRVKTSAFGKFFFRKEIRELPETTQALPDALDRSEE